MPMLSEILLDKEDWKEETINGTRSAFILKGLSPGTSYKVRVYSDDHTDLYSEDIFQTGPGEAFVQQLMCLTQIS